MIDRGAGGESVGAKLLHFSGLVFAWRRHQAGSVHRQTLRSDAAGLRPIVRSLLSQGRGCGCPRTEATCRELLDLEPSLWTFASAEGWRRTTTRPSAPCGTG
jgi:transposase